MRVRILAISLLLLAMCLAVPSAYAKAGEDKLLVNPAPVCCLAEAPHIIGIQAVDMKVDVCKWPDLHLLKINDRQLQFRNQAIITPFRICYENLSAVMIWNHNCSRTYSSCVTVVRRE